MSQPYSANLKNSHVFVGVSSRSTRASPGTSGTLQTETDLSASGPYVHDQGHSILIDLLFTGGIARTLSAVSDISTTFSHVSTMLSQARYTVTSSEGQCLTKHTEVRSELCIERIFQSTTFAEWLFLSVLSTGLRPHWIDDRSQYEPCQSEKCFGFALDITFIFPLLHVSPNFSQHIS